MKPPPKLTHTGENPADPHTRRALLRTAAAPATTTTMTVETGAPRTERAGECNSTQGMTPPFDLSSYSVMKPEKTRLRDGHAAQEALVEPHAEEGRRGRREPRATEQLRAVTASGSAKTTLSGAERATHRSIPPIELS